MLTQIDYSFKNFAKKVNGKYTKDERMDYTPLGYENRTVKWEKDNIKYSIQIFPTIEKNRIKSWVLGAAAYKDIEEDRYLIQKSFFDSNNKNKLIKIFDELLNETYMYLNTISISDLVKMPHKQSLDDLLEVLDKLDV